MTFWTIEATRHGHTAVVVNKRDLASAVKFMNNAMRIFIKGDPHQHSVKMFASGQAFGYEFLIRDQVNTNYSIRKSYVGR